MVIAYRYTGEETAVLREIFHSYDTECTGTISLGELRNAFSIHEDLDEEDVDQIFLALVSDKIIHAKFQVVRSLLYSRT